MAEPFKTDIKDISILNDLKLKHIFQEAKDRLKSVLDDNKRLVDKSYILAGILASGSITAFITTVVNLKKVIVLVPGIFTLIILYFGIAWLLFLNLRTHIGSADGRQPKDILNQEVCRYDFLNILISEIEEYQSRITKERRINNELASILDICIWATLISPIIAVFICLLCLFLGLNDYFSCHPHLALAPVYLYHEWAAYHLH